MMSVDIKNSDIIRDKIYTFRNMQVMLDFDLAAIYGYEVKRLNEQVKRNINRFPDDFMFKITKEELDLLKSQIATSPMNKMFAGQGRYKKIALRIYGAGNIYVGDCAAWRNCRSAEHFHYACIS